MARGPDVQRTDVRHDDAQGRDPRAEPGSVHQHRDVVQTDRRIGRSTRASPEPRRAGRRARVWGALSVASRKARGLAGSPRQRAAEAQKCDLRVSRIKRRDAISRLTSPRAS